MNNKHKCILAALFLASAPLLASGFGLYEQGVQGQGNAGAFVARAEDGSALFYNPAGLARSRFAELAVAGRLSTSRSFYSNAGQSTWRSDLKSTGLPTFFYNNRVGNKFGFGIGSAVTYDYELDWAQQDYPGRFLFNGADFRVTEYLAGAALRLSENLSLGATLRFGQGDYGISTSRPRGYLAEDPAAYYETDDRIEMDDTAVGYTLGLQYYQSRRFAMGLAYHSPMKFSLMGNRTYSQLTALDDVRAVNAFNSTWGDGAAPALSTLELPQRLTLGVNTRVTVRTRLEVDATWEEWSNIDETRIYTNDAAGNPEELVIPRQWNDTYTIRVAGDFQQKRALLWRIGLASIRGAVPSSTFQPDFPDYDRFLYSFGVGYTIKNRYTLEGGWQLVQNRDRTIRDKELYFDPNAPDYVSNNGQEGIFETQRIQVQVGLRIRLGAAKE